MTSVWRRVAVPAMVLCVLMGPGASADGLPAARPAREGISPERLQRLSERMNEAVADGTMIGGVGVIARHGRVVYEQTYGLADRESGRPMTTDAIFRIYSMSKPITSVAVMLLYEEGRFFLNDPVADYIPELADLQVAVSTADGGDTRMTSDGTISRSEGEGDPAEAGRTRAPTRQPTIRDLLTHTAGFTYGVFGNTEVDRQYREAGLLFDDMTLGEFADKLGDIPLQYDPGTRWHYSVGIDLLGRLVEAVSGTRFGDFLETRVFEPLEMNDTSFVVPADKWPRVAQIYTPKGTPEGSNAFLANVQSSELVVAPDSVSARYREGSRFESGGGGLVSTAADYLRFSQMLLNGGELDGVRLLSPKTVALMTTNQLGDIPMGFGGQGVGFGLGFAVALDQGRIGELGSVGAYNWGGAAGTRFWIDPAEQLIGVFMVQSIPHRTRLADEFKNLTYQAIVE